MKILVTSSSKHGSTGEIASFIADRLGERGLEVDTTPLEQVGGPLEHDAVVLGSAVYVGSWTKSARAFVKAHRERLASMPVWLFSSGPTDDNSEHAISARQWNELEEALHPRAHVVFGGRLDLDRLGFVERRVIKAVKVPTGDFRDWGEIASFADRIADALTLEHAAI